MQIGDVGDADDPTLLQQTQYQLDAVRFSNSWVGCANLLNSLFDETIIVYNRTSTDCMFSYLCGSCGVAQLNLMKSDISQMLGLMMAVVLLVLVGILVVSLDMKMPPFPRTSLTLS
jgi:hypothetical protein